MAQLMIDLCTIARKALLKSCCVLSLAAVSQAQADTYAVQVGAFATPPPALAESYSQYGTVRVQRDAGLSRVLIGAFDNRDDAQLLLLELNREGFGDAFIRTLDTMVAASHKASNTMSDAGHSHIGAASHRHMAEPDLQRLNKLSAEEKTRAVYLDGVLHLKEGERFIPLP